MSTAATSSRALRSLLARLRVPDQPARGGTALATAHVGAARPRGAVETLCAALDAPDSDLRWAAAAALARIGDAADQCVAKVARSGPPRARRMALYCLRGFNGPHKCGLGAEAARDGEAGVRLAALAMIAARGHGCARCAKSALRLLERDRSAGVRRAAAAALGRIGVTSAAVRAGLRAAAQSADNSLARAARGALGRLGSE